MSGSRRLGDIFFDRDLVADKPFHIKVKYYATAIGKLIWYILKYRFNDFLQWVESLAALYMLVIELGLRESAGGGASMLFA